MGWLSIPTPLVIGHRGASAYAPENTLAAFELAAEQGADGIEFDVQLSADGWPVIIHDLSVDRTTNGHGEVAKLTLAELSSLDAGEGQQIPTLDGVLDAFGERLSLLNIEIKCFGGQSRGIEEVVADRIRSRSLARQTIVSSFDPQSVRRVRHHLPSGTPVALLRAPGLVVDSDWLMQGDADHPHYSLVDEDYVKRANRQGLRVHVWTVDEPGEALRLTNLNVHAIITNKPDLIRSTIMDSPRQ